MSSLLRGAVILWRRQAGGLQKLVTRPTSSRLLKVRRFASAVPLVAFVLAALASAAPANRASFPGRNGPVAFGFGGGTIVTQNVDGSSRKTVVPLKTDVS